MKSIKKVTSMILSLLIVLSVVSTSLILAFAKTVNESENNNDVNSANQFTTGSSLVGSLSSGTDVDWYEFTAPGNGYIDIKFTNPVLTDGNAKWAINIYKSGDTLDSIHYHLIAATKGSTSFPKIGVTTGKYYIKVADGYYNYGKVSNVEYSIKVDYTASEYWESELNNSFATADEVNFSQSYGAYLYDGYDEDYYEFTADKNGYIEIDFSNPVLTDGNAKWAVTVFKYDDSYDSIHYHDVYATKGTTEFPKIGITPGTYYIKVADGYYNYGKVANTEYSIKVSFTATNYWESELNNNFATADEVNFSQSYGAYLYDGYDEDYYEFTADKNGYIEIDFSNPVLTDGNAKWAVTVFKYDDSYDSIHYHDVYATKGTTEFPKIGITPGTYYIKVADGYYNYGKVANTEYNIKVDFTASEYWESELNNTYASADKIYGNASYNGYLYNGDDIDYYEFKVTKNGNIDIKFTNPVLTDTNAKWSFILYKYSHSYDNVYSGTVIGTSGTTNFSDIGVTPGTYYIKISDGYYNYGKVANVEYSITVSGDCVEQTTVTPPVEPDVTLGDVNNDGVVDAGDAVLISRYDAGFITLTAEQLEAGDVNGDGVVDAGDAVIISRFDAGFISSLS